MSCKVTQGIINTCTQLLRVGGSGITFWVGYIGDLDTPIDTSQTADLTEIDFGSYGGLYRFDGQKYSHAFGSELVVSAGGNKSYKHSFAAKLLSASTDDDKSLQDLAVGNDIFIVGLNNSQEFFILGGAGGMTAVSGSQNTGQTVDSDTSDLITLEGAELTKPLRFNLGTYAATLARIEGYEVG